MSAKQRLDWIGGGMMATEHRNGQRPRAVTLGEAIEFAQQLHDLLTKAGAAPSDNWRDTARAVSYVLRTWERAGEKL